MWQPGWEGSLGENGYMHVYGWVPFRLSTWTYHNIVNWLCAKSLQSCPTLCNPMDCSPSGSSVHGILQARLLQWVVMPSFSAAAAAAAKSLQSCPTLCDPIDGSPPGSPVPGILQAKTLEWVAISFSSAWKWKVKVKSLSRVRLLATPWTAAHQAPPSTGFSRQECWSGVPLPSVLLQYKIKSLENERICRYTCIGIKRWLQHGNRQKGKRLQSRVYSEVSLPARGSGSAVSLLCDSGWVNLTPLSPSSPFWKLGRLPHRLLEDWRR